MTTQNENTEIDWKAATIRRDCLTIAVQITKVTEANVIELAERMYQYVTTGDTKL